MNQEKLTKTFSTLPTLAVGQMLRLRPLVPIQYYGEPL